MQDHESLDVNPRFNEGEPRRGKIPWLWWGMRWMQPQLRNQVGSRFAPERLPPLPVPAHRVDRGRRKLGEIWKKASWTIAEKIGSTIPLVPLFFMAKDLFGLSRDLVEARRQGKQRDLEPGEQQRKGYLDLKSFALDTFRTILDPRRRRPPRCPSSCCWTTLSGPTPPL